MENGMDFLDWLEPDTSIKILMNLEDISDVVRASAVSRSWQHFVIANGLSKQLCLKIFPQLSRAARVIELNNPEAEQLSAVTSSGLTEWETKEMDHRSYAFLAQACKSVPADSCISEAISASSTDNFPQESIQNTLEPRMIVRQSPSYWSSKGQKNPAVPETLTYKLVSDLCVITEIDLQPFQAFFQYGSPTYSAKSVRFRMGHTKSITDVGSDLNGELCHFDDDKFMWTYTSQEFPMAQESRLQKFELPEPVLCIGGVLQIELLGRVQRQEMDNLFYICVSYVRVLGFPLSPAFAIEMLEPSGKFVLKRNLQVKCLERPSVSDSELMNLDRRRALQHILSVLRGNVLDVEEYQSAEEEDGVSDEDLDLFA